MVATSLPFWMQHPSRTMSPFPADSAMRLGASVAPGERRAAARALFRPKGVSGLSVELCDAQTAGSYEEAWSALASRAIEPNVFLEPGFALAAVRHFPPAQRPQFLLVWCGEEGGRADLVGLCALKIRATNLGLPISTAWTHDQATSSAPLLDRDHAGPALDAILDCLSGRSPEWSGLLLKGLVLDGPIAELLTGSGRQSLVVERRSRTVLHRPAGPAPEAEQHRASSQRHLKELRRQRRRLADEGACTYRSARSVEEVRAATEQFLHLEARGWKGGRGTALLNDAGLAAFTRAMTRQLARTGLCRIDSLEVAGEPVAMGILLLSGDRAFFWKTTYDERLKRRSPGKQLAAAIRDVQLADRSIALTDSCAVPDHQMIGQVWDGRMTVADLLVASEAVEPARLARAARKIGHAKRMRAALKASYLLVRRTLLGRSR